ncbi:MAG: spore gernimation protein [Clostridiales bacterium]|jgi:spore germination protein KA|nr:spore gernimation protein [Clostridiales bacterium]
MGVKVMNNMEVMSDSLISNVSRIKEMFHYPLNSDLVIREIYISSIKRKSVLFYMNGIVNEEFIDKHIIKPLIEGTRNEAEGSTDIELIKNSLQASQFNKLTRLSEIAKDLLDGKSILLIEGYEGALSSLSIKYEHRNVERSQTENVTKGSHESFVESSLVNRSLIRKYLKSKNLITETLDIGVEDKCDVHILYHNSIASPELINEVKQRINRIMEDNYNGMISSSIVEQYIEDTTFSIVPTVLFTELPDRAVSFLKEGHVVIFVDNSPSCLIVPATFWSFFHTPEDMSYRWIAGNFIRLVRIIAVFISLLTPAIYIAVTNYHQEMIPTDLLLAISATRESVPFPIVFEVVGMEIAFEIIRECSFRIPTSIGSTVGIVGTLILGQAAVQANIISPILVIVVALTGLSSFAVSNTDLNMSIRVSRFFFTFCAIMMGFLGLALGIVVFTTYIVSIESFGVPFLAPITPHYETSRDMIFRSVVKHQWLRPLFAKPKLEKKKTQPKEE